MQFSILAIRLVLFEGSKQRDDWSPFPLTILIWYLSSTLRWLLINTPKSIYSLPRILDLTISGIQASKPRPTEWNVSLGLWSSSCKELLISPMVMLIICTAERPDGIGKIGSSTKLSWVSSLTPDIDDCDVGGWFVGTDGKTAGCKTAWLICILRHLLTNSWDQLFKLIRGKWQRFVASLLLWLCSFPFLLLWLCC